MKRPKRINIDPFDYEVRYMPDFSATTNTMGSCVTDAQIIFIDAGLTDQAEKDTVLHEALHGAWSQTGLQKEYTEDQQEAVIWALTPRLLAIIRDNPELIQWLSGR